MCRKQKIYGIICSQSQYRKHGLLLAAVKVTLLTMKYGFKFYHFYIAVFNFKRDFLK